MVVGATFVSGRVKATPRAASFRDASVGLPDRGDRPPEGTTYVGIRHPELSANRLVQVIADVFGETLATTPTGPTATSPALHPTVRG